MKTAKSILMKLFVAAALLLLAPASRALTTDYMVGLSNNLSGYRDMLAPSPDAEDQKKVRAFDRALKDLSKPASTVAQDYDRFFLAVLHLGSYAFTDSILVAAGDDVSVHFILDAAAQIGDLSARTNGLNDFVSTRKAAMKNIDQAYLLLLANISETNKQTALLRGRQIFKKLTVADKLVAKGEDRLGHAPNDSDLGGLRLDFEDKAGSGSVTFENNTFYNQPVGADTVQGTYAYTRTGLDTAVVVLTEIGGSRVTTLKLKFASGEGGKFAYKIVGGEDKGSSAGTFTLGLIPPG